MGYGTDEFPAFYSRQSGHKLTQTCETPEQIASLLYSKWNMALKGGVVVANPIPLQDEIPDSEIAPFIDRAVAEAEAHGIHGKETTPFLLKRIAEITSGRSLKANIALVMNNARLAADIAVAYSKL